MNFGLTLRTSRVGAVNESVSTNQKPVLGSFGLWTACKSRFGNFPPAGVVMATYLYPVFQALRYAGRLLNDVITSG
jgi:hypothetical protein